MKRVYLFSPIPYAFLRQRPQHLADRFRTLGCAVTYIEPSGFLEYVAGRKKGILRLLTVSLMYFIAGVLALAFPALRHRSRKRTRLPADRPDFTIVELPVVYPTNRVDSPLLEKLNASIFRQAIKRRILDAQSGGEDSYAIVQNPFFGLVLDRGDFERICYDCLDDLIIYAGNASVERFASYERRLLGMTNVVSVTADKLEQHVLNARPDVPVVRVPNGVDFEWFQDRFRKGSPPIDVRDVQRPIVGYVGILATWFDYELVAEVARCLPNVSVVVVGPLDFEYRIAHLKNIPNLSWLGRKPYEEVPLYVSSFDVCMIPFHHERISQTTNPVKIYEYFAFGKPVVSTPLHELEAFAKDNLVYMRERVEPFVGAVCEALDEKDESLRHRRQAVARENSWEHHARTLLDALKNC